MRKVAGVVGVAGVVCVAGVAGVGGVGGVVDVVCVVGVVGVVGVADVAGVMDVICVVGVRMGMMMLPSVLLGRSRASNNLRESRASIYFCYFWASRASNNEIQSKIGSDYSLSSVSGNRHSSFASGTGRCNI
jgi:hypothetical protein